MRYVPKDGDQARDRARRVKDACEALGHARALGDCQAAVARAWGFRDWAEALATRGESLPDEEVEFPAVKGRIERQVAAFRDVLRLPERAACAVAYASRPSSAHVPRRRDARAATSRFDPFPGKAIDLPEPPDATHVRVWALSWEESERGWGERPDGHSVHLSPEDGVTYVDDYWARQPKAVPDEYDRPAGHLFAVDLALGDPLLTRLLDGVDGLRTRPGEEDDARLSRSSPPEALGWRSAPPGQAGPAGARAG